MSLYLSAPDVTRVVIHPYPRRRRATTVLAAAPLPMAARAAVAAAVVAPADSPCYADFFRPVEMAERVS